VRLLALLAVTAGAVWGHGAMPTDPATIVAGHPTGHVHDHGDMTWPPQPSGISNVKVLTTADGETARTTAAATRTERLERGARLRPEVGAALGRRFVRIAMTQDDLKTAIPGTNHLIYFSHSRNATVDVSVDDNGSLRAVRTIAASDYQPEIADEEIAAATDIARAYFMAAGESRVTSLKGFGILAYRPEGRGFYDSRVLYISFHPDSDSPPQMAAWVDLSHQKVLRTRLESP
jgi:hypothetical protein